MLQVLVILFLRHSNFGMLISYYVFFSFGMVLLVVLVLVLGILLLHVILLVFFRESV